jgi:predicted helicase
VVDFILRAADHLLRRHFGHGLTDRSVHVLDPFTGTGTFIVRLLESGLIGPEDLARKYARELHANEILLLAYYIAAANIESTYQALAPANVPVLPSGPPVLEPDGRAANSGAVSAPPSAPFPGIVLADTFQMTEADDPLDRAVFEANNERAEAQRSRAIRVIVGNPPYSVGQTSGNDDNQNLKYPTLDAQIEATYAKRSTAVNKNSLYDSYIRAIRWASDRIRGQGIVAFVSNGGYIDGNTADGLRKTLVAEFDAIYVYNLRGNARSAGQQRQKEAGNVFGSGSRNTVAILLLVKLPPGAARPARQAKLFYRDIGDYLTREEKLAIVAGDSIESIEWQEITPNAQGDWTNQRAETFARYTPIGARKSGAAAVFHLHTRGVATGRDAWVYDFSEPALRRRVERMVRFFNRQSADVAEWRESHPKESDAAAAAAVIDRDPAKFSWNRADSAALKPKVGAAGRFVPAKYAYRPERVFTAAYRPFCREHVLFDRQLNDMVYRLNDVFPTPRHPNIGFTLTGASSHYEFALIATDCIPDLHLLDTGQFFPRWRYEPLPDATEHAAQTGQAQGELDVGAGADGIVHGYRRIDNITDAALAAYRLAYGWRVTKDDVFTYVYALLHSPDYRRAFAADLKKTLPRIPLVDTLDLFEAFAAAGRDLLALHVGYEQAEPYPGLQIAGDQPQGDPYAWFRVAKMRYGGKAPERDKTVVVVNPRVTLSGIPLAAQEYLLGARSALDWVLERYQVKTDKASGIVNDPNAWAQEHANPRYILDLLTRIVTVSARTVETVNALPPLNFTPTGATTAERI